MISSNIHFVANRSLVQSIGLYTTNTNLQNTKIEDNLYIVKFFLTVLFQYLVNTFDLANCYIHPNFQISHETDLLAIRFCLKE